MSRHASASATVPASLDEALRANAMLVVGFCAAWCDTCGTFREAFDALAAAQRGGATFVWLDIEDDADVAGDIEVENFPTLAVYANGRPVHFGVSLPQFGVVARLVAALDVDSPTASVDPAVAALPARLHDMPPDALRRVLR